MRKITRVSLIAIVTALIALLIYKPSTYMSAISEGLMLFVVSVLPAMFPFFFFSKILSGLGVAESLAKFAKKPMAYLFNAPDIGGYIYAVSIMSGYPIGAKLVSDSYACGIISENDCKKIIAFTSTSGPLFILGTIGSAMLGSSEAAAIMLVTHYIGALLNGLLYRGKKAACDSKLAVPQPRNYDSLLSDAINGSITSVFAVGGYIAIFNMIITALTECGVFALLGSAFNNIIPTDLAIGALSGIVEVTRGALLISKTAISLRITVPIISALVAFGGLSITLQSLTFLTKCKISPQYYLLTKLTQAIITYALATVACLALL